MPEWVGGRIYCLLTEFKKKCEQKIQKELFETYQSADDIPDSLLSRPVDKNMSYAEIQKMDHKAYYFKNEPIKFVFEINNYENREISREDTIDYIVDPEGSINKFVEQYDKTDALRNLKMYYLTQKALSSFVASNEDVVKKEILQVIRSVKDSVKNVRLYIMGRDENRSACMEKSIEGTIIECMYPTSDTALLGVDNFSTYTATGWSLTTKVRFNQEPIKEIYFDDIVKITMNRTVLYEKK